MPGKQVKNWRQYHTLRDEGMSKAKAAKITNASEAAKRKRRRRALERLRAK